MTIHNHYLPQWLHRLANGAAVTAIAGLIGAIGWAHFGSKSMVGTGFEWLLWLALPLGVLTALFARPGFSVVEGSGALEGYDELLPTDDKE